MDASALWSVFLDAHASSIDASFELAKTPKLDRHSTYPNVRDSIKNMPRNAESYVYVAVIAYHLPSPNSPLTVFLPSSRIFARLCIQPGGINLPNGLRASRH